MEELYQVMGLTLPEILKLKKDAELHSPDYLRLLKENIALQGKVAFYESRIKEMSKML